MGRNSEIKDMSCRKCFPIQEITGNSDFLEFWEWYREIMDAEIFTGETVRIFNKLKAVMLGDRMDMNEENFAELTLLSLSIRYNKKPKYDIWEISLEIIKILSVSRKFGIGIKKTIEKLGKEKVISEGESSRPKKEIHEKDSEVITIYVNKKGIFNITKTGKEFRIEIDENNDEKRISGNEVIELCGSTKEDMNSVFEEIDKLVQELNERQEEITILEELENDIENTDNRKGKTEKGKEKEILEDEFDEFENVINRSGFGPLKNSESKKESQELETESESEEEPLIVNPLVNMALSIIKVRKFNGENIDPEDWLQEFIRAAAPNQQGDDVKVDFAAAHLEGAAAQWFEKDQELLDVVRGRINEWNDTTNVNTLARSFVTKFKEEFVSEEAKEEKKREWFYQWEKMKQLPGESIDTYTKKYQKMIRNAERNITEEEKVMKYQEGLLPMYYANATIGNSANLTEAIRNARNSERGVLRQLFPDKGYEQTNKIHQELQKKEVTPEEIDELTKQVKEMKIQLMQSSRENNEYERKNRRYNNFDKREIICYKCNEKGHITRNCRNNRDIKCYICGKMEHYASTCKEKN